MLGLSEEDAPVFDDDKAFDPADETCILEHAPRRRRISFKFLQMAHDRYERILVERG